MKILISACITGINCKYDGKNNYCKEIERFLEANDVISVCPEMLAGLPSPREPAEIHDGKIINKEGVSLDDIFKKGAKLALEIAVREKIDLAILQSRSPSCGVNKIYDGSFTGKLIDGHGIFAQMLIDNGIKVMDIEDFINMK